MTSEDSPANLVRVRDAREQAIARLSDAFAHDNLVVDEFEARLTRVHQATSLAAVEATVSDLEPPSAEWHAAQLVRAPASATLASEAVTAIFGGVERRGAWSVPRQLKARAILGGIVLDFRDAALPPGVTDLLVSAVLGGIEIIVPPSLSVEVSGTAIFGGFGHVERVPTVVDPDRPVLRVRGRAVLGGVAVETRLPGESEADASRHRSGHPTLGTGHELRRLPAKSDR